MKYIAMMTMSTTRESFFHVILQGATTINNECKGRTSATLMQQSNIICCHLQDATTTILHHAMTSCMNMPRAGMASTPEMACTLLKASTLSRPKMVCTLPRASREKAKLFCMQFVLHADMLFLQCSAVLYPAEHFRENGRHFPFNS